MTTLTPVVVEETIQASLGDYADHSVWESTGVQDMTVERIGETCKATAANSGEIILDAGASATDDFYNGLVVEWNGEQRLITDYVGGTTQRCTVGSLNGSAATFTGTPQANDSFTIYPIVRKGLGANENFALTSVVIGGQTTDQDAHLWLTTQADASWRDSADPANEQIDWNSSRTRIDVNPGTSNTIILSVNTPYTIVQGWQIRAGAQQRITEITAFGAGAEIRDCLIVDSSSDFQRRDMIRGNQTFVNCVIFWNSENGDSNGVIEPSAGLKFINCSFFRGTNKNTASTAIVERLANVIFRSCAFYGDWGSFQTGSTGTIEVDHCATNLASFGTISSGANNITSGSIANDVENIADEFGDGRAKASGNLDGNADVELETDYGSGAVDVFGQARSGTVPWIGAFEIPASGTPVDSDHVLPFGSAASLTADRGGLFDSAAALQTDRSAAFDFLAALLPDATTPVESMAALARDAGFLVSSRFAFDADRALRFESLAGIASDGVIPAEWGGAVLISADALLPVEWRNAVAADRILPLDSRAVVVVDRAVPAAWRAGIRVDRETVVSWLAGVARDVDAPVEWDAIAIINADAALQIEWLSETLAVAPADVLLVGADSWVTVVPAGIYLATQN